MTVLVVGLSHRSAPVDVLERAAVAASDVPKLVSEMLRGEHVSEAMLVSTCNRVEVYAVVDAFHGGLADVHLVRGRITYAEPHLRMLGWSEEEMKDPSGVVLSETIGSATQSLTMQYQYDAGLRLKFVRPPNANPIATAITIETSTCEAVLIAGSHSPTKPISASIASVITAGRNRRASSRPSSPSRATTTS